MSFQCPFRLLLTAPKATSFFFFYTSLTFSFSLFPFSPAIHPGPVVWTDLFGKYECYVASKSKYSPSDFWAGAHAPGAMVFGIEAFGSGQSHSASPPITSNNVLAAHEFGGSTTLNGISWVDNKESTSRRLSAWYERHLQSSCSNSSSFTLYIGAYTNTLEIQSILADIKNGVTSVGPVQVCNSSIDTFGIAPLDNNNVASLSQTSFVDTPGFAALISVIVIVLVAGALWFTRQRWMPMLGFSPKKADLPVRPEPPLFSVMVNHNNQGQASL